MCGKNPKCQKCIRFAIIMLLVFMVVQIILAIIKGTFTKNIVTADVTVRMLETMMTEDDLNSLQSSFGLIAFALSIVTIAGVMCAFITLCSAKFCGSCCGGFCTKIFTFLSFAVFLAVSIIWMLMGAALMAVQPGFDEETIQTNCDNALKSQYDDMKVDLKMTSYDTSEFFKEIITID